MEILPLVERDNPSNSIKSSRLSVKSKKSKKSIVDNEPSIMLRSILKATNKSECVIPNETPTSTIRKRVVFNMAPEIIEVQSYKHYNATFIYTDHDSCCKCHIF